MSIKDKINFSNNSYTNEKQKHDFNGNNEYQIEKIDNSNVIKTTQITLNTIHSIDKNNDKDLNQINYCDGNYEVIKNCNDSNLIKTSHIKLNRLNDIDNIKNEFNNQTFNCYEIVDNSLKTSIIKTSQVKLNSLSNITHINSQVEDDNEEIIKKKDNSKVVENVLDDKYDVQKIKFNTDSNILEKLIPEINIVNDFFYKQNTENFINLSVNKLLSVLDLEINKPLINVKDEEIKNNFNYFDNESLSMNFVQQMFKIDKEFSNNLINLSKLSRENYYKNSFNYFDKLNDNTFENKIDLFIQKNEKINGINNVEKKYESNTKNYPPRFINI